MFLFCYSFYLLFIPATGVWRIFHIFIFFAFFFFLFLYLHDFFYSWTFSIVCFLSLSHSPSLLKWNVNNITIDDAQKEQLLMFRLMHSLSLSLSLFLVTQSQCFIACFSFLKRFNLLFRCFHFDSFNSFKKEYSCRSILFFLLLPRLFGSTSFHSSALPLRLILVPFILCLFLLIVVVVICDAFTPDTDSLNVLFWLYLYLFFCRFLFSSFVVVVVVDDDGGAF